MLLLLQRIPSLASTLFAEAFFAPLVILFPRRFSRSTLASSVVGFLSEICTVRLAFPAPPPPFTFLLLPVLRNSPPPPRSGQLSRKRIWKWVEAMVLTSFGLVLLLFCLPPRENRQCIFYNAAMSLAGRGLFAAATVVSVVLRHPGESPLTPSDSRFRWYNLDRPRTSHVSEAFLSVQYSCIKN